jgi:ATP-dependent exoDNAse (exonuclease V) beta subunit
MFEFVNLPELDFDLQSKTENGSRKYVTPNGDAYPSVTTILSAYNKKAIQEWRERVGEESANKISTQASTRGTRLHSLCESYLLNELSPLKLNSVMPDAKELFVKIKPKLDDNIGKIYSLEQALYSDKLRIAGRVDCIAEWNGELSVIDFKTASKEKNEDWIQNYFMQCSAYAEMFEERTGRPINQIVVAIAVSSGDTQIFVKEKENYLQGLNFFIDEYYDNE